jgi:hypothetical protein
MNEYMFDALRSVPACVLRLILPGPSDRHYAAGDHVQEGIVTISRPGRSTSVSSEASLVICRYMRIDGYACLAWLRQTILLEARQGWEGTIQ